MENMTVMKKVLRWIIYLILMCFMFLFRGVLICVLQCCERVFLFKAQISILIHFAWFIVVYDMFMYWRSFWKEVFPGKPKLTKVLSFVIPFLNLAFGGILELLVDQTELGSKIKDFAINVATKIPV